MLQQDSAMVVKAVFLQIGLCVRISKLDVNETIFLE